MTKPFKSLLGGSRTIVSFWMFSYKDETISLSLLLLSYVTFRNKTQKENNDFGKTYEDYEFMLGTTLLHTPSFNKEQPIRRMAC